jgi:flavin-dependent dehydrogenase
MEQERGRRTPMGRELGQTTDVLIVGGSYAGLAAAEAAAREGARVVLLERASSTGLLAHCGCGTWADDLRGFADPASVSTPIRVVRFISSHEEACFDVPDEHLCVLDSRAFMRLLSAKALDAGAAILTSHAVTAPIQVAKRVSGVAGLSPHGAFDIRACVTIDCSGTLRHVARHLRPFRNPRAVAFGLEYEFDGQAEPDVATLLVGGAIAPTGYGWISPCPGHRTRVGVGLIEKVHWRKARTLLDNIIKQYVAPGIPTCNAVEMTGGILPCDRPVRDLFYPGLALAGDSAGQVSLVNGEGTRHALHWGRLVGRASAKVAMDQDTSALDEVRCQWKDFRRILMRQYLANRLMIRFSDSTWDRAVRHLSRLGNRDFCALMRGDIGYGMLARALMNAVFRKLCERA